MENELNWQNIFKEYSKGERILNFGSRMVILILTFDSLVISIFQKISVPLMLFILVATFFAGLVTVAFAYIQIDKVYKMLKTKAPLNISAFHLFSPLIIFFSSIWLIDLQHEIPTFPKWLYWMLVLFIAATSEVFIYLRKKKIRENYPSLQ